MKPIEVPAMGHPCELVGDYSEAFLACSYNDLDVLYYLLSGQLNNKAQSCLQMNPQRTRAQLGEFWRPDERYAEQLWAVLYEARGWPHEWQPDPVEPLPVAFDRLRREDWFSNASEQLRGQMSLRVFVFEDALRKRLSFQDFLRELAAVA